MPYVALSGADRSREKQQRAGLGDRGAGAGACRVAERSGPERVVRRIDHAGAAARFVAVAVEVKAGAQVVTPQGVVGRIDGAVVVEVTRNTRVRRRRSA